MADKVSAELDKRPKSEILDGELLESFSGPAVLANRIFLTITGSGARLSFMEQHGDKVPPQFRTAVILSFEDALALRDLLERQLKDIEKSIKAAKADAQANADNAGQGNG